MHYRVIVQDRGGILVDMEIEASDEGSVEGTLIGCLLGIEIIRVPVERRWSSDDGKTLLFQVQGNIDSTVKAILDHEMRKLEHRFKEKQEDHRHKEHMAHSHHRHIEQAGQAESRKREVAELYHQFGKDVWKRADYDKKCEKLGCEAKSQAWCKKHYP